MLKDVFQNIDRLYSYEEYRIMIKDLLVQQKSTSFEDSEALFKYSELNEKRMSRLDKTAKISEETIEVIQKKLTTPQRWIVISESWCGDAAQSLPVLNKIANSSEYIDFKIALRDRNLPLIDAFLTNGGRAIPKLIILDQDNQLIDTWGPRPSIATQMVQEYKEKHGKLDADFKTSLQIWYNKNKGRNIEQDILNILT